MESKFRNWALEASKLIDIRAFFAGLEVFSTVEIDVKHGDDGALSP